MSEPLSRKTLLKRAGVIGVVAPRKGAAADAAPEDGLDLHVCLTAEGRVLAFNGHVDLGTGIRTALAQMVAEELDFPFDAVEMVLGDTVDTPDQGPTIASETIQVTSLAIRIAATQIRGRLITLAAAALSCGEDEIALADGVISRKGETTPAIALDTLLANERILLPLAETAEFKQVDQHRLVGRSVARVDIPAKVTGCFTYVHDVRVAGMLHGRVVRPPYAGMDAGDFVGKSLIAVDCDSIADVPGIRAVVIEGDFIGIVAEREEWAAEAALKLKAQWREFTPPDLSDLGQALRAHPSTPRLLAEEGDVDAALGSLEARLDRTYVWPYHMHGSIGPSCAVADVGEDGITVWTGSQNPYPLQNDLAVLTGLPKERIDVIRFEAAGCYGRNCADDVVADAVLLSRAVGAPVRVQLTREQEHLWEPKGAAQLIDIKGGLGPGGSLKAYDFHTWYPSNAAPTLALLLTGRIPNQPAALRMGDRTAVPSYNYENMRLTAYDMPPIIRASWLRGVSAMPNVFAHESYIDELAHEAGVDPVEFRLRHINDERAAELTRATAERANWQSHVGPRMEQDGDIMRGRGFAQARYVHGSWPGVGAAWAAWVADVAVNRTTGEVTVSRVTVGQDTGMMVNPAGVTHQIHGNVLQSTSRVLREEVTFSQTTAVASRDWGSYPVLTFPELPAIDVMLMDRQHLPPMGAGESASVPSAAAIVNAVYDATGVRFRELPLTPERVLAGLNGTPLLKPPRREPARRLPWWSKLGAAVAGAATFAAVSLAFAPSIAPIARPDPSTWSAATIERGRQLAALGACAVCHTAKDGVPYAGGLALPTPFGTVLTTNITPDVETGIGTWSYAAFERAMRAGLHRDGRQLYPAFPYPSFAKASEADLQALYAFLMSQPAVLQENEPSKLTFPFNLRPLLAGWNLLFNRGELKPDAARSAEWNRGRYLVDGLGHCGACHTPRNALGAEKSGSAYLAGGEAEGWTAPALTKLSAGPIPWSEAELYAYLKTGTSRQHGAAAGPMAPVIAELRELPDADIRAMATYLASLSEPLPEAAATERVKRIEAMTASAANPATSPIARLYDGACAACHETGRAAPLLNAGPMLGLSSKLHAATPTNLVNMLLEGGQHGIGSMPSFATALDDRQLADLAAYLRGRFAPEKPGWSGVEDAIAQARKSH
ncbi:MAG: molybdopterin-dependent oxidoreductase [Bosea sp.]|uniref:molybdopterin cofactor-binding domain-containing protein n=1 Tax=Bosea sp. (in: a-proteobacteria) TaxID=1871050 RepID=UPI002397E818|nr:molybdopterin-dependent oxidoreductase [Bosea sp. (in: a-proteobacteria)]MCP4738705.1 molybdopterin-dependent oxidoreductase [Bosea sp. (in: a-proteobacteria)]